MYYLKNKNLLYFQRLIVYICIDKNKYKTHFLKKYVHNNV